jgi:predicted transcriptional regulator
MRTTLNLHDDLIKRVGNRARETGKTLTEVVEAALQAAVTGQAIRAGTFTPRWKPVDGRTLPGIDLADRDALYREMEGR